MMTYKDTTLWKEAFNDKYGHIALREIRFFSQIPLHLINKCV